MNKIEKNILFVVVLLFSNYLNASTITWDTVNSYPGENDIFNLDIVGLGFVDNVDGGGVNISFDPSVVNVLSVSIDPLVWNLGFPGVDPGVIDNGAGTVSGIKVNTMLTDVTGDFIVATVQFQVVGALGLSSSLALSDVGANPWASGGFAIDPYPTFVGGQVFVAPVPSAVWLFGSGLLALTSLARRKRKV